MCAAMTAKTFVKTHSAVAMPKERLRIGNGESDHETLNKRNFQWAG